jgi:glycosyltransferase involved in cell wall biosynthesis
MEIGGSQLNAIEIGEAVQALGHSVLLVAEDGRLSPTAEKAGLEHIRVSERRGRPSLRVMRLLDTLVQERGIDVVHGYEWPPVLDAWLGPHLLHQTPIVATVMSAVVAPFIPRSIPLVVGVEKLRQECQADGFGVVTLLEPPVNIHANSPLFVQGDFRRVYGIDPDTILVAVVCRLARELKLEGLLTACRVVGKLAAEGKDVQLVIVGDGPVRAEVEAEAALANGHSGHRKAIIMTGELEDPRPAYASADITLGMGGSALRAMAFGKPLIVQGESGFWKLCSEASVSSFLDEGWYGLGDGRGGDAALRAALEPLLQSRDSRAKLGDFGRKLVVDRFSLEHAAEVQLNLYQKAIESNAAASASEVARTVWGVSRHNFRRKWVRRWCGNPSDDFNSIREQRKAADARKGGK